MDKIAHTKFFADVSEWKPIRKLMEEVSSTRLILNVEVTRLEGLMTVNMGPPPSDRLWYVVSNGATRRAKSSIGLVFRYGFRQPPQMSIKGVPQVGDRTVVLSTISDWIESKIQLLLEKVLVVPNMVGGTSRKLPEFKCHPLQDDVVIPVLSGNELLQGPINK